MSERQTIRTDLADNLRAARARSRLTQGDVADAMTSRGFDTWHRATLSLIERYQRSVTAEELVALAEILDTTPNQLLPSNSQTAERRDTP
jgi:transcriptional regulator with XRE-family HTH domain